MTTKSPAFIGTFDPFHGAHVGQLLRAYQYRQFPEVNILVNEKPAHKPHASALHHRLKMAQLTLEAAKLPFTYTVRPVSSPLAPEMSGQISYKITGIDSLLEILEDPQRWAFAQQWPMIVLSVPGVDERLLTEAVKLLPGDVKPTIRYEYVSEAVAPMRNYDFDSQTFVSRRIHATYLRSGKDASLVPLSVRRYIQEQNLYQAGKQ
jgi:nicotinic acid mononucleotide adenylyltransferase